MLIGDEKIKMKKEKALRIIQSLQKLRKEGIVFLLRTHGSGVFGGIVYHIEEEPPKDTSLPVERRKVLYIITPDGREAKEYADYWDGSHLEDLLILKFPDSPFLLTMRTRPSLTDEEDDVEWMMHGAKAEHYFQLKSTNIKQQEEIRDLMWLLEQKSQEVRMLKAEVERLRERERDLSAEVERLSRENVQLKDEIRRIAMIAEEHLAGRLAAESAMEEILARARALGLYEVMGGREYVEHLLKETKKIREEVALLSGDGHMTIEAIQRTVDEAIAGRIGGLIESKMRELLTSQEFQNVLEQVVDRIVAKKITSSTT